MLIRHKHCPPAARRWTPDARGRRPRARLLPGLWRHPLPEPAVRGGHPARVGHARWPAGAAASAPSSRAMASGPCRRLPGAGETTAAGAARETDEGSRRADRAGPALHPAQCGQGGPGALLLPGAAALPCSTPAPNHSEARLFAEHEVPWDEIAFRTSRVTVERFEDYRAGRPMSLYAADIA